MINELHGFIRCYFIPSRQLLAPALFKLGCNLADSGSKGIGLCILVGLKNLGAGMYQSHFCLNGQPFKNIPNTQRFFAGGQRGAVLDALVYAINNGEGITKVVGEVGSGKTMLCRMLETKLSNNIQLVYLANPSLSPDTILHAIGIELNLAITLDTNKLEVLQKLQNKLLQLHAQNKKIVVLVEEAQAMPLESLEEIRLLSNLETNSDKLLQIVLFGQPELDDKLSISSIRQLSERISNSFYLPPFDINDVRDYINFRLASKGGEHIPLFNASAIRSIYRYSKGLIRRINILADKTLLAAYSENSHKVLPKHVRQALSDCEFNRYRPHYKQYALTVVMGAGLATLSIVLFISGSKYVKPLITANEIQQSAPVLEIEKVVDHEHQTELVALDNINRPALEESHNRASLDPLGQAQQRIKATEQWVPNTHNGQYTIQLMTSYIGRKNELIGLEKFLTSDDISPMIDDMYVHQGQIKDQPVLVVSYQGFDSYSAARNAASEIPQRLQRYQPLVRTIKSLRAEIAH